MDYTLGQIDGFARAAEAERRRAAALLCAATRAAAADEDGYRAFIAQME